VRPFYERAVSDLDP